VDKFALYHDVCNLQNLAGSYIEGEECAEQLQIIAEQLSLRKYRVAVVGEFKRGKSSLVNCILGTEILPTDILPTTAVVNRIIYDTEEKIVIKYKDGKIEENNLSEIANYATKLDEEKERFAATIAGIDVHYPSLFCQNNIELFDTPGLNDDEIMTKVTIDVLDDIDTAIVVISAMMPLSMTEQNLICSLLEKKDIYHLTFVISFIDKVSDEEEEQDRVVDLIKDRLENDTYERFCKKHENNPELMKKAESILKNPAIFAVSAKQAIQGFVKGDKKLLEKSRFTHFKFQLSALLTANQELDMLHKTKRIAKEVYGSFDEWNKNLQDKLDLMWEETNSCLNNITKYQKNWYNKLIGKMQEVDNFLKNKNILVDDGKINDAEMVDRAKKIFIYNISEIREWEFSEEKVTNVLEIAAKECSEEITESYINYKNSTMNCIEEVNKFFFDMRKPYELDEEKLFLKLEKWRSENKFPEFVISAEDIISKMPDICGECMPYIQNAISNAKTEYYNKIKELVFSWRTLLLQCKIEEEENISFAINMYKNNLQIIADKNQENQNEYPKRKIMLEEVCQAIESIQI